ncbi:restriction endonuclease subunit S [Pseudomonas sp. XK-1]|uniref:restriction endonuclease subunit S n=1 Tax=Pseudomonas sp. XK-1 TaxID=3136019 RepID=UPI003119F92E
MSEWANGTLADTIASLDAGVSVNAEDRPHGAGEIGVLKTSAIIGGAFRAEQNKAVLQHERRLVAEPVQADSILVSRMNTPALVGESCYVREAHPTLFLPDRLWQLKPRDRTQLSIRWLSFVLQSADYRRYVEVHATGTSGSMKNLPKSKLLALPVQYPEPAEQVVIAQILDTLDTAIRETEALIDKLKAVKQGLLHDLLTRGIDANGQLRPPQSEAPQLYKESPLGWIPREWEILPLEDVADLQVGFAFKSEWFLDTGKMRLLRGDNVGYGSPEWETVKYFSDEAAQRFADYLLKEGDVVIGMDRTFTKTGSKFSVINQDDLPCLLVQRVGRFMPRLCSMGFLRQLTLWPAFQRNLLAQQKGMDIPHLSKSEILSPFVPVPTTYEQGAISERMASFEQRITSESSLMAKLKSQKTGLMDDLLTGRVRVTPLLESVQQAAAPIVQQPVGQMGA